jgi:beta-lactamase class A
MSPRPDPAPAPSRTRPTWFQVVLALTADLVVLLAFLFFALGNAALDQPAGAARPAPPAAIVIPPEVWPPANRLIAIEEALTTRPPVEEVNLSVAMKDEQGRTLVAVEDSQPFVLASVAKLYLMVAYLAQVDSLEQRLGEDDLDLLDPMIRYSDNRSATNVWEEIGELQGLNHFLLTHGFQPLTIAEEGAWGTLEASAGEVAALLQRLAAGRLLAPESTQLAMKLLSRIDENQAWGVSSGVPEGGATVYLKNGWYPEEDGWRINSAGAVQTPRGTYFIAVFAYPTPTMDAGVEIVERIASQLNSAMR